MQDDETLARQPILNDIRRVQEAHDDLPEIGLATETTPQPRIFPKNLVWSIKSRATTLPLPEIGLAGIVQSGRDRQAQLTTHSTFIVSTRV
jgi:hypothetical protein